MYIYRARVVQLALDAYMTDWNKTTRPKRFINLFYIATTTIIYVRTFTPGSSAHASISGPRSQNNDLHYIRILYII